MERLTPEGELKLKREAIVDVRNKVVAVTAAVRAKGDAATHKTPRSGSRPPRQQRA